MIRFLFKAAIRNIFKDKYQSFLNILGLTLGFAAYLFIATYFFNELSFDRFHTKSDRLFRCVTKVKMGDTGESLSNSEVPLAQAAKKSLPEVENATRFYFRNNVVVKVGENKYVEKKFWYADANVFELFDFNLLKGDMDQVLTEPNSVIITPEFSKKYFGDVDPIGKTIELNEEGELYEVTGILEKVPANSHLQFDMLASFSSMDISNDYRAQSWGNFRDMYTYLLLQDNTDLSVMNKKLQDLTIEYYIPMFEMIGMPYNDFLNSGNYVFHSLQPLRDIYLNRTYTDETILHGNKQLIYALGLIGLMIIVIACFNFINLSTARATLRAKEIGVKKIIGSGRKRIIAQILIETFFQCIIALAASLVLLIIGLSVLNNYTGLNIQYIQFFTIKGLLSMLGILLLVVAIAGIFPSFVIARFNPIKIIKGTVLNWNANSTQRNVLVSFQFVVFIVLISCTMIVKKQISLLHHQNPGFYKENVLVIKNTNKLGNSQLAFKEELEKNSEVIDASYTTALPSMFDGASNPFSKNDKSNQIFMHRVDCDADFLSTLKINLLDGRDFTSEAEHERNNALINKKAAEVFGWTECSNKIIFDYNGGNYYNVIGIVEDFHIGSLREKIEPMIIRYRENGNYLAIRIQPESATIAIESAKTIWKDMNKQAPFEFSFLDLSFDNQYKHEARFGKLISLFSLLSVVIACLGLLGLVSFTLMRKQKEIGIRKVNGAKVSQILTILNKNFVKWVAISFVIATPVAWYIMHGWLENFAYKTHLNWWVFALAGIMALGIALLTVSWQSWRAATRNPVKALKYE
jgi:putative ABC transport system permease protein